MTIYLNFFNFDINLLLLDQTKENLIDNICHFHQLNYMSFIERLVYKDHTR